MLDVKETRFSKIENNKTIMVENQRNEIDVAVYAAIKSFMNSKTREAFPNALTICSLLGITEPTFTKSIRRLENIGDICRERRGRKLYYKFLQETGFWKPIDLSFIEIDPKELSALEKGFIILLRKYLYGNTDTIHINIKNLSDNIGISYSTIKKRIQRLQERSYLFYEKGDDDVYNYISSYKLKFNMEKLQLRLDKIEEDIAETKVKVYNIESKLTKIEEDSAQYVTKKDLMKLIKEIKNEPNSKS
jgi:DNA-binding MarR family transcriptional regulator